MTEPRPDLIRIGDNRHSVCLVRKSLSNALLKVLGQQQCVTLAHSCKETTLRNRYFHFIAVGFEDSNEMESMSNRFVSFRWQRRIYWPWRGRYSMNWDTIDVNKRLPNGGDSCQAT